METKTWNRKSNYIPGLGLGNKYNFSDYLRRAGDWVYTDYIPVRKDVKRLQDALSIWSHRHKCRTKTQSFRFPQGWKVLIEVVSNYR